MKNELIGTSLEEGGDDVTMNEIFKTGTIRMIE